MAMVETTKQNNGVVVDGSRCSPCGFEKMYRYAT
jgi:hypothetical protein